MESIQEDWRVVWVAALTLLSWLGVVIHNAIELPQLTLISPENSIPALISLFLFVVWWRIPGRRIWISFLIIWAGMHLIFGAVISVLPLPFLPFEPEQTITHYLSHLIYGAAQIPLMIFLWRSRQ